MASDLVTINSWKFYLGLPPYMHNSPRIHVLYAFTIFTGPERDLESEVGTQSGEGLASRIVLYYDNDGK
jgi:hypothetical protein